MLTSFKADCISLVEEAHAQRFKSQYCFSKFNQGVSRVRNHHCLAHHVPIVGILSSSSSCPMIHMNAGLRFSTPRAFTTTPWHVVETNFIVYVMTGITRFLIVSAGILVGKPEPLRNSAHKSQNMFSAFHV